VLINWFWCKASHLTFLWVATQGARGGFHKLLDFFKRRFGKVRLLWAVKVLDDSSA
jgi:hypothetical protein